MKRKEMIQLVVAITILLAAGYLIFTMLVPRKAANQKGLTYEKVTPINPDFNEEALRSLTDSSLSRDFYAPPDLKSGVGNSQPFTPIR
ncbi:MAG TPA: hypothetical protein VNA68_03595 [Candidatus Dormibacteraeota bacterium]|nr:hypothetical protein [Candidatus Dormibacteraeota bacterium]